MKIGIIDYGAGNLQNVCNALKKLKQTYEILVAPKKLAQFDKIILPGVGAAQAAMKELTARGFVAPLKKLRKPLLGICLGLQVLADFSEEGNVPCLSIIPGRVRKFPPGLKTPQIGWNRVAYETSSPLMQGIPSGSFFYFVNSYYFDGDDRYILGRTDYNIRFASVISHKNIYATQFHPEKSGDAGMTLLNNFCTLC